MINAIKKINPSTALHKIQYEGNHRVKVITLNRLTTTPVNAACGDKRHLEEQLKMAAGIVIRS